MILAGFGLSCCTLRPLFSPVLMAGSQTSITVSQEIDNPPCYLRYRYRTYTYADGTSPTPDNSELNEQVIASKNVSVTITISASGAPRTVNASWYYLCYDGSFTNTIWLMLVIGPTPSPAKTSAPPSTIPASMPLRISADGATIDAWSDTLVASVHHETGLLGASVRLARASEVQASAGAARNTIGAVSRFVKTNVVLPSLADIATFTYDAGKTPAASSEPTAFETLVIGRSATVEPDAPVEPETISQVALATLVAPEDPHESPSVVDPQKPRSWLIFLAIALVIVLIVLVALLLLWWRRNGKRGDNSSEGCQIGDAGNFETSMATFDGFSTSSCTTDVDSLRGTETFSG